ncbi:16397_t:CDS:2 [Entrophospora sp. SA101]|nr:16397_t:CDS:2 [Entrophospora sp. SA101]
MSVADKYIGLTLAIASSVLIGTSFIITKKGLIDTSNRHDHSYLKNPIWWFGMITMVLGELLNFAAYSFAPAILVTPLGALSERLGKIGSVGCGLCLIGSIIIVLHAPADKEINTVDEILSFALKPVFMYTFVAIYKLVPKYGKKNPVVFLSICSLVGSISVMSCKGFGIALKLTFAGNNQLSHTSTYVFIIISVVCILVQMNYFNKALDIFSTNIVNPIYYVFFTTSTIIASVLLFQGFNTGNTANLITLFCGFLTIFAGVYLLNIAKNEGIGLASSLKENNTLLGSGGDTSGNSSIMLSSIGDHHHHDSLMRTRDATLLNAFDEESLGLTQLNDDITDSEDE